jgi:hypothetical protein
VTAAEELAPSVVGYCDWCGDPIETMEDRVAMPQGLFHRACWEVARGAAH